MDIPHEEKKKYRAALIDALMKQAEKLKAELKKSETIPNPWDLSQQKSEIDAEYTSCMEGITTAEPSALELCAKTRDDALYAAKHKAFSDAQTLKPILEAQHSGWTEVLEIYTLLEKGRRDHNITGLFQNTNTATKEKQAYYLRLLQFDTETQRLAAELEKRPAPSMPEAAPSDTSDLAQEVPENTGMPEGTAQVAQETGIAAAIPAPAPTPAAAARETQVAVAVAPTRAARPEPEKPQNKPTSETAKAEERPEIMLIDDLPPVRNAQTKPTPTAEETKAKIFEDPGLMIPERPKTETAAKTESAKSNVKRLNLDDEGDSEEAETASNKPAKSSSTKSSSGSTAYDNLPTAKLIADAQAAMSKQQFAEAVKMLEAATKKDPNNHRAWLSLAKANERLGKLAIAASQAEKSCKLSKTDSCYTYLGDLRGKAGMDNARDAYLKALEINPNNAKAKSKVK
jgi:tetratricopeptide (TPR) repeat protein